MNRLLAEVFRSFPQLYDKFQEICSQAYPFYLLTDMALGASGLGSMYSRLKELKVTPKREFQKCSKNRKNRWHKYVNCKISREKFEPEPGFEPRSSGFLALRSTT